MLGWFIVVVSCQREVVLRKISGLMLIMIFLNNIVKHHFNHNTNFLWIYECITLNIDVKYLKNQSYQIIHSKICSQIPRTQSICHEITFRMCTCPHHFGDMSSKNVLSCVMCPLCFQCQWRHGGMNPTPLITIEFICLEYLDPTSYCQPADM